MILLNHFETAPSNLSIVDMKFISPFCYLPNIICIFRPRLSQVGFPGMV